MPLILFVDDEQYAMQDYVHELQFEGFTVVCAKTADECLRRLEERDDWAAVVLDMMMPGGDARHDSIDDGLRSGIALLRNIRERRSKLPVLVFSNFHSAETEIPSDDFTIFRQKLEILPSELATVVRDLAGR